MYTIRSVELGLNIHVIYDITEVFYCLHSNNFRIHIITRMLFIRVLTR